MRHDSVREGSEAENEPPERVEAARISRDMETIFGATTAGRPAKKSIGSDPVETLVVPRPKRARKPAVGAPTLLALGALIGGGLAWLAFPSSHIAPVPVRRPAPTQWAQTVELPPNILSAPPQQVEPARTAPLPAPASIVPAFGSNADGDAAPVARVRRPTVTQAAYHPARDHARSRRIAASRSNEPCADMRGLWRARCMRPQILAADRRLRDAYDGAVRAGVDRRMLVAYRNRWSRLRDDAVSDPSYVAVTYQQMAQSLDAARSEATEF